MNYPFGQTDFMGAEPLVGHSYHSYPNTPVPELPADQERLLYLSNVNGYLTGRNSVLENENERLRHRVDKQSDTIKEGREQNKRLSDQIDDWRDKYFEIQKDRDRLRQYEPKDKAEDPGV